jgi:hypothetical protein
MTGLAARRARDRARKRRQREARRLRASREAEARAVRLERNDASGLPPEITCRAIIGPPGRDGGAGLVLRGPRIDIVGGHPVAASALERGDGLAALARKSGQITAPMLEAARQFQADYREVASGVTEGVSGYGAAGGGAARAEPGWGVIRMVAVRARFEAALAWAGAFTPCLLRVAGEAVPLAAWAREEGLDRDSAIGWLVAALRRLRAFYEAAGTGAAVSARTDRSSPSQAAWRAPEALDGGTLTLVGEAHCGKPWPAGEATP